VVKHSRLWTRLAIAAAALGVLALIKATLLAPDPVPVRTAAVDRGPVAETVANSRAGTVKARRRAKLSPETGGRVVAIPHPKGSRVRRGDTLLKVDDQIQRAQLDLAEREATTASAQREQACLAAERAARETVRTRKLAAEGIVSTDLLDGVASQAQTAEAACKAAAANAERARSAVALARVQLEKAVLRAPFDGIVADLFIELGEWTTPSPPALPVPPVLELIDASSIYVSAPMDEVDSARIRPGLTAKVTVDSHPGRPFDGRVLRVAPYVLDRLEQNRTVEIEVELLDRAVATTLLPGTSADAEVVLALRPDVPRVPTSALLEGGRVLAVEKGRLVERAVGVGLKNWDFTEITSGLAVGDPVVISFDRPEVRAGARARIESPAPRP
jgi:HlyD family secretion protein